MDWDRECQRSAARSQARRTLVLEQKHGWWRGLAVTFMFSGAAGAVWLLAWLLE